MFTLNIFSNNNFKLYDNNNNEVIQNNYNINENGLINNFNCNDIYYKILVYEYDFYGYENIIIQNINNLKININFDAYKLIDNINGYCQNVLSYIIKKNKLIFKNINNIICINNNNEKEIIFKANQIKYLSFTSSNIDNEINFICDMKQLTVNNYFLYYYKLLNDIDISDDEEDDDINMNNNNDYEIDEDNKDYTLSITLLNSIEYLNINTKKFIIQNSNINDINNYYIISNIKEEINSVVILFNNIATHYILLTETNNYKLNENIEIINNLIINNNEIK